jgi:hypothetical protein
MVISLHEAREKFHLTWPNNIGSNYPYVNIVITVRHDITPSLKKILSWFLDYFFLQSLISKEVPYEKT